MDPTAPFLVRRVLMGVLVGLVVLALGCYGWVRYSTAQYHDRESAVVHRYQAAYRICMARGLLASGCAAQVYAACSADAFWRAAMPLGSDLIGGPSDATQRCQDATADGPR